jgi:predicted ATP-grasp superfamily ATP-dependent carboligase
VSARRPGAAGALVLGSDYKALGVVRSLGRNGIPVGVVRDDHLIATWSRYARRTYEWPSRAEADRVAYLLDLAERHELGGWALFPTDDESAALLARNRDALAERFQVTVPPWDVLRWAYDKRLTYRLADTVGVDHPRTYEPRNRDDVMRFDGEFPAILKPAQRPELNRFTISKAWPVRDRDDLAARYDEAAALIDPSLVMIQEIIPGGGEAQLSFAALCEGGEIVASLVARRNRQWPADYGRSSTYVETVDAPDVEACARLLLSALRFDGIVEVEFKRDPRDGRLKLLDINPRVWGWHTLGRRAGVDFPMLLWRMTHGGSFRELHGRLGVRWVRAVTDVPAAVHEIRAGRLSVKGYLASLRGPIEYAILAPDDPLPALGEIPAGLYLAWRRRKSAAEATTTRPGVAA